LPALGAARLTELRETAIVADAASKKTPLFEVHARLGARMTEFGGFQMPVSYSGIIGEHLAVRSAAGLFDLSHMGEFELRGPGTIQLLERALTNSATRLTIDQAQYTLMCQPDGGVIDDLIAYRLGSDRFLLCVNAANIEADKAWLAELNSEGVEFRDRSEETALIALQGPRAQVIVAPLVKVDLFKLGRFKSVAATIDGLPCRIARTGYTGEDGFEIFLAATAGQRLFELLLDAGRGAGVVPCGLGARDTLRMEAGLPLYGHELDRQTTPLEAGLGAYVRLGRGFVGERALSAQRAAGPRKRLIGLQTDDRRSIARQRHKLFAGGAEVGVVSSGTFAPSFDQPLAIGYVGAAATLAVGAPVMVEIRRQMIAATVTALPFYRRTSASRSGV
jgi:glycine cleavage system T protein (aminomethyltransferase)